MQNVIPDLGFTNKKINMYVGETIDFSSIYEGYVLSGDNLAIEGAKVTATTPGITTLTINGNGMKYKLRFNIEEEFVLDELSQELCDHNYVENNYCKYCGCHLSTINFKDGTNTLDTIVQKSGLLITEEIETFKNGYTFVGWYREPEFTNEFDLSTDTANDELTLYGKWIENPVINNSKNKGITFDGSTGTASITSGEAKECVVDIELPITNIKGGKDINGIYSGVVVTDIVDGQVVTLIQGKDNDYTVSEGSVKINLTEKYLNSMKVGSHSIEIAITDSTDNVYKYPITMTVNRKPIVYNSNNNNRNSVIDYKVVNTLTK